MNLSEMTYPELAQHQKDVESAMRNLEKTRRATAKEHGFTVEDLFNVSDKVSTSATKSAPKYRNPENHAETWTGKGRKPQWITAALESGADLSSFEI